MRKVVSILTITAILTSAAAVAQTPKKVNAKPTPIKDSLSYVLGINVASTIKQIPAKIDPAVFCKAVNDMLGGKATMTAEESDIFLKKYFDVQKAKAIELTRKEGQAFLAKNKSEAGVVSLPSGLQYKILREGTGIAPLVTDEVEVNYRGTLVDGSVFDSSYDRGESITFPLNKVIKGWTEGLQHVKEGGKIMLYIPDNLAYGNQEKPGSIIKPGSMLIFEVELIKVIKPTPKQ